MPMVAMGRTLPVSHGLNRIHRGAQEVSLPFCGDSRHDYSWNLEVTTDSAVKSLRKTSQSCSMLVDTIRDLNPNSHHIRV